LISKCYICGTCLFCIRCCICRDEWFTAGTRDPGTTGPISRTKFSWTDGDQGEVSGAQFWFSGDVREKPGNRIVYHTDGKVIVFILQLCCVTLSFALEKYLNYTCRQCFVTVGWAAGRASGL